MAYATIRYDITYLNQADTLPKRSIIDIITSLIYDIEKALASGKVAILIIEDIMGAFNTILANRIILCL